MKKNIVVQKYGGSSVKDADHIKRVAGHIIDTYKEGNEVVAVVSAPGDTTDELLNMASRITDSPDSRELDVLLATGEQQGISLMAMAIKSKGYKAVSLTGTQVGILTDSVHSKARIKEIDTSKLRESLNSDNIVIVAGFQGISKDNNITTLGRGGSDLSAVALASVLDADVCEIYTDVDGVYSTDPRITSGARKIDEISYDEMMEMASTGAKVLQSRSIEVAKKNNIDINIRSSMKEKYSKGGTMVTKETKDLEQVVVRGVTLDEDQVKISIVDVPDKPGVAAEIFGALAEENINVDMIIQSSAHKSGVNDISFSIAHQKLNRAREIMEKLKQKLDAQEILIDRDVDKVSIVGVGMKSHAGVAAKMFDILSENDINIEMISTSEIKVSCVVSRKQGKEAVRALHREFCEKNPRFGKNRDE
ncbi:MAG: aspartate kinase [Elusimicrobiota bacterium]